MNLKDLFFSQTVVLHSILSPERVNEELALNVNPSTFPPDRYNNGKYFYGTVTATEFQINRYHLGTTLAWRPLHRHRFVLAKGMLHPTDNGTDIEITFQNQGFYRPLWLIGLASIAGMFLKSILNFFIRQGGLKSTVIFGILLLIICAFITLYFHHEKKKMLKQLAQLLSIRP